MQLQFLYGSNLLETNPTLKPGTIYLDVATGELYFDDPSRSKNTHEKIIDTATLIYTIKDSVSFPSIGNEDAGMSNLTSAVLGTSVLGYMILGST